MRKWQLLFGSAVLVLLPQFAEAWGRVGFGIGINVAPPFYYGRPYYYPGYPYYYAPPPLVYAPPPPVYVQPAPVAVQAAPTYAPAPSATMTTPAQAPQLLAAPMPVVQANHQGNAGRAEQLLQQLRDEQETTRRDAAMDLGRLKTPQAIDPLTQMLSKDGSPVVREAAARALGLIGSPRALNALIYAAQADQDRDVRHSAQFAIEVIRANLRN
jgi:hypothetical protein